MGFLTAATFKGKMTLSPRFSWTDPSAPDASKDEALYQSSTHISKQIDSMGISVVFVATWLQD
jgi:hypothetical protein